MNKTLIIAVFMNLCCLVSWYPIICRWIKSQSILPFFPVPVKKIFLRTWEKNYSYNLVSLFQISSKQPLKQKQKVSEPTSRGIFYLKEPKFWHLKICKIFVSTYIALIELRSVVLQRIVSQNMTSLFLIFH